MADGRREAESHALARVIGTPRSVLDVGGTLARNAEIAKRGIALESIDADIEREDWAARLGARKFDVIVFGGELARLAKPVDVLRRFLSFLENDGRILVLVADDTDGGGASRTTLVEAAGLEVLHVELEGRLARAARGRSPKTGPAVVVARRPFVRRELSLTVGMISMNEAGAVGGVIDDIRKHAPDADVLLVDSSKDETPQIAESKGARVVRQFPPRGYGNAMHRLLYEARTDAIITMDCDGTYPADRIVPMLRILEEGADLVNATRTRHRPSAMPLPNYVANRLFATTTRLVHGTPTTDVHSGMRAYRTSMLRGIEVDPKGPALPVELLVVPARLGYRIVEIEIPYLDRIGSSTLQRWDSTKWTFRRIFRRHPGGRVRRENFENR